MVESAQDKAAREERAKAEAAAALAVKKEALKRAKRKSLRTCANDRSSFLSLYEKTPTSEIAGIMSAHLDSWGEALMEISQIDDQLMEFIDKSKSLADIEEEEASISEEYDRQKIEFNVSKGKLKRMQELLQPATFSGGFSAGRHSIFNSSFLDATLVNPLVKIQEVPVPKFDGRFSSFPDWYSEFSSIVDKNESFDDFQKLYLLKRSMGEGAEHLLKDIGNDGSLYKATFQSLYDTYFNRRRIIAEHFSSLVDMQLIKNNLLRENVEKIKHILRGLAVCGINVEAMSPLIAFLTSRKIKESTSKTNVISS